MATRLNTKSPTIRRILREAQELADTPSADFVAAPLDTDLFEWHFTLRGPPDSPYADGIYHGRIVLPPAYPLRPPMFRFTTPSGRFETNAEICLSISGHHEETWQPAWGLRTALVALRAFMETDAQGQLGGVDAPDAARRRLAQQSGAFRCPQCSGGKTNREVLAEAAAAAAAAAAEKEDESEEKNDEIPPELKMVTRQELQAKAKPSSSSSSSSHSPSGPASSSTAAVSSSSTPSSSTPSTSSPSSATPPAPAPVQIPAPTPTIPLPAPVPAYPPARRRPSDEAVPVWVDRAIVILCVALIAILLRMATR